MIVCCCTRILFLWCYGTSVDCTCARVIHRTVVVCTVRWYVGTLDTLTNRNIPVVLLTRYSLSQRLSSNKLQLHTLCHGGKFQGSSRGITHEQSHGYVRVGTMRGGLGIRLRAVVTGLWRVGPHDPLHFLTCLSRHWSL